MLNTWAKSIPKGKTIPFMRGGHAAIVLAGCAVTTALACAAFAMEHASAREHPISVHNHDWEMKNRSYEKHVPTVVLRSFPRLYHQISTVLNQRCPPTLFSMMPCRFQKMEPISHFKKYGKLHEGYSFNK